MRNLYFERRGQVQGAAFRVDREPSTPKCRNSVFHPGRHPGPDPTGMHAPSPPTLGPPVRPPGPGRPPAPVQLGMLMWRCHRLPPLGGWSPLLKHPLASLEDFSTWCGPGGVCRAPLFDVLNRGSGILHGFTDKACMANKRQKPSLHLDL